MTTTDLEADLRDLVAELAELPVDEVETDTSFEDAGIDSLLAMEIAVHVERRFGVRFEDTELKTVQSVRQLADAVREKQG
jgi:acyl carrier protein